MRKGLRQFAFEMGAKYQKLVLVLASKKGGKPILSCYVSKTLVESSEANAATMVKTLGKYIQGGGGGQAFFATAGGKDATGIEKALAAAEQLIVEQFSE